MQVAQKCHVITESLTGSRILSSVYASTVDKLRCGNESPITCRPMTADPWYRGWQQGRLTPSWGKEKCPTSPFHLTLP